MREEIKVRIKESIEKLEKWVEKQDYKGYEPFDGLTSPFRILAFGNLLAERIFLQAVRLSPINLRPLLGIRPLESTKGMGYMAGGYIAMFEATGQTRYKEKAIRCLDWLIENKSPKYQQFSWGNHFDYAGRIGKYPKFESTVVWTSLIGLVFLDAYELFHDMKYLEVAASVTDWIVKLPKEITDSGTCLSYHMLYQSSIHNSNMLGASMLARTAKFTRDKVALKVARESMEYSCTRQLPVGAWYYGEASDMHWIDNFHTGYNLNSLKCYIENTGDDTFNEHLSRGFKYYLNTFFEPDGTPKYYHNRVYPIDIQCASQAIDTLTNFADYEGSSLDMAVKVATWTINNMQDEKGYFYYRKYPFGIKAKVPMFHWGQATMYKALSSLFLKLSSQS